MMVLKSNNESIDHWVKGIQTNNNKQIYHFMKLFYFELAEEQTKTI